MWSTSRLLKCLLMSFKKICSNLTIWGDSVVICTNKDGVKFSVIGDLSNGNVQLKQNADVDSDSGVVLQVSEDITLSFALKKLMAFTKATPLSSTVTLSMSDDVPLAVEYRCEDLGYIRYFLAPKIEDEDSKM